jgi:hypothetical protein
MIPSSETVGVTPDVGTGVLALWRSSDRIIDATDRAGIT